jgi:hypothetical protein
VDLNPAVVINEAQLPELIHEHVDPGARCPHHFRQRLLGNFRKHLLRLVLLAIVTGPIC